MLFYLFILMSMSSLRLDVLVETGVKRLKITSPRLHQDNKPATSLAVECSLLVFTLQLNFESIKYNRHMQRGSGPLSCPWGCWHFVGVCPSHIRWSRGALNELLFHCNISFVAVTQSRLYWHIVCSIHSQQMNILAGWGLQHTGPCATDEMEVKLTYSVIARNSYEKL